MDDNNKSVNSKVDNFVQDIDNKFYNLKDTVNDNKNNISEIGDYISNISNNFKFESNDNIFTITYLVDPSINIVFGQ